MGALHMHSIGLRLLAVTTVTGATLALSGVAATAAPTVGVTGGSSGSTVEECHDQGEGASARGGRDLDHRDVSAVEQRAIEARTGRILDRRGISPRQAKNASATIPVYVHVMASKSGAGDVSDAQIADQIDVLNATFGGQESSEAADSGFSFTLAGTDRFYNDTWHRDGASSRYRKLTRQGGADALNVWLVDFMYLGVATFPWDYGRSRGTDGIRVHYGSLPGGSIANYNLGETATHEAGHWLGLYHTFQGGCRTTNDQVEDTPAQGGPSSGCPVGADTCPLPGLDPIHNYMDYSFDSCYNQFTAGQSARMAQMWAAYRA
jgi:hypothetical protein